MKKLVAAALAAAFFAVGLFGCEGDKKEKREKFIYLSSLPHITVSSIQADASSDNSGNYSSNSDSSKTSSSDSANSISKTTGESSDSTVNSAVSNNEAATSSTNGSGEQNNETVWVSENGTKYHSKPDCSNMKTASEMPKSNAETLGYSPCKRCYKQ